jgi:predicted metal-dependent hydrolase
LIAKPTGASFTSGVLFDFLLKPRRPALDQNVLRAGGKIVPIVFIRHPLARRYVLRLRPDGSARVTVPRSGSISEGRRFAERNQAWLEQQIFKQATKSDSSKQWFIGTEILFRGEFAKIESSTDGDIRLGAEIIRAADLTANGQPLDLRPAIETCLRALAVRELPPRLLELAAAHQLAVHRITIRDQKSRWGSCSRRRTVSLNWRLIQTPANVRDYILLHELMHLREMNHSARFWRLVEQACPDYPAAERWLKQNASLLK